MDSGVDAYSATRDGEPMIVRKRKRDPQAVLVVGRHERAAKYLKDVLAAREAGVPLARWMRERGATVSQTKAAQRLQARMRKRGERLTDFDCVRLLRSVRAEIVDRIRRRVGVGTAAFVADCGALREIEAALRQAAVWERQDKAGGGGTAPAPAAPAVRGAAVRGARGARNGATGARVGGKAAAEASVGALSVGETGGSEGECAVEAAGGAVGALVEGLGVGQGGESGAAGIGPLAGC